MSTDLAIRTEAAQMTVLSNEQLQYIAATEFVPPGLRGNLPAILACVATGRALGIADMTALRSIHIIDGKATFSAELMVHLVRARGHSIVGDVGEGSATVVGRRVDNGDEMRATWTLAMAERAGLANKQNWRRYPEAMLWARAVSQLCRMLFADCFAGTTYTPEELDDSAGEPQAPTELQPDAVSSAALSEPASPAEDTEPLDWSEIPFGDYEDPKPTAAAEPEAAAEAPAEKPITDAQKKKANVLVGQLRTAGLITTEQLYARMGYSPLEEPKGEDGRLHWAPLRDRLTRAQASDLIDRLERFASGGASA